MNYYFTSDEHYGHENVIKYCNRPFATVEEMDDTIINNHNSVVNDDDIVIHAGDFTLKMDAAQYTRRLKGNHVFLKGSHDYWMKEERFLQVWEHKFEAVPYVVVCHYAMRVWPRHHHGAIMLYGHSHGVLPPLPGQWDIGVDNNKFFPISLNQVIEKINKQ